MTDSPLVTDRLPKIMRFLFIHVTSGYALNEPLGILELSGMLKANGHKCELIIPEFEKNFLEGVKRFKPDMIGYSCIAGSEDSYLDINRFLKKHLSFISIMGGSHPTFAPDIIGDDFLDIICRGEGDYSLLDLANRFDRKESINDISNLWIKKNGRIIKNNLRPLIRNLDNLPMPDRHILYKYDCFRYYQSATFMASRGCPFECSYCFNHAYIKMYGENKVVRHKSIERTLSEIKQVKNNYRLKRITFQDDVFITDPGWVKEFAEKYHSSISIPFSIFARAEMLNENVVRNLSSAGCQTVIMAIESGVERIRREILKRNMSNDTITRASNLLHKYGISLVTQNMIGIPDEGYADIIETLKINVKCKPAYAWVSIFQPYRGTLIYEYCRSKGLLPNSYKNTPSFNYPSGIKNQNSNFLEKMHKLFAFFVRFPFLLTYSKGIMKISNRRLLKIVFILYKSYSEVFRQKLSLIDKGLLLYIKKIYIDKYSTKFMPKEIR